MDLVSHINPKPMCMMTTGHDSNIFCLAFNHSSDKILSGGNDHQIILHDIESRRAVDVWGLLDAVYSISVSPTDDHVFVSACEDGSLVIRDTRLSPDELTYVARDNSSFQSVMYNPTDNRLIASSNAQDGLQLWDTRRPHNPLLTYESSTGKGERSRAMSARWNPTGTKLVALRRRMTPVLYDVAHTNPEATFDHPGYYNSCTMKTCTVGGPKGDMLMSGSDDFCLYAWNIPESLGRNDCVSVGNAAFILKGHRSIVNQVRYSRNWELMVTSGVEKVVKLWSPLPLGAHSTMTPANGLRPLYTHQEYINMVLRGGGGLMAADSLHNNQTNEDTRMMAFFDSLVQREIEEMSDDSDNDSLSDHSDSAQVHLINDVIESGRRARTLSHMYSSEVVDVHSPSPPSVEEDPMDISDSPSTSQQQQSSSNDQMGEVDEGLGYNDNNKDAVRDVTQLVIRKRQKLDMILHKQEVKGGQILFELDSDPTEQIEHTSPVASPVYYAPETSEQPERTTGFRRVSRGTRNYRTREDPH